MPSVTLAPKVTVTIDDPEQTRAASIIRVETLPEIIPLKTNLLYRDATKHFNIIGRNTTQSPASVAIRRVTLSGPAIIYASVSGGDNSVNEYTITNLDSFTTYSVSVSAGSVSYSNGVISVTAPTTTGTIYMTVNCETSKIEVVPNVVMQAVIDYPASSGLDFVKELTIALQGFEVSNGPETCAATEVQVCLNSDFTTGTVYSFNQSGEDNSILINGLPVANGYYIRARYVGATYGAGPWSETRTINILPAALPDTELYKFVPSDGLASDMFGRAVAISADGTTVAIGSYLDDETHSNRGSVYVYNKSGETWSLQTKIVDTDSLANDRFGEFIAISNDGNRLVVSSTGDDDGVAGNDAGSIAVYHRSGSTWTRKVKLIASDAAATDTFGYGVSISGDGNTIAVGSPRDDNSPNNDTGSVYIFTYNGTTWTQQAKLLASDRTTSDWFGYSTSLSYDGNKVVIGAIYDDTNPYTDSGSAYVFTRSGTTWSQQAKLVSQSPAGQEYFGAAVSMSQDGTTIAVGAYSSGGGKGAVYIYTTNGTTWSHQATLIPSGISSTATYGISVALSADGNVLVAGAQGDITGVTTSGSMIVHEREGTTWALHARVFPSDPENAQTLGTSIAITPNGQYAISGAYRDDTSSYIDVGSAYLFG